MQSTKDAIRKKRRPLLLRGLTCLENVRAVLEDPSSLLSVDGQPERAALVMPDADPDAVQTGIRCARH